MAFDECDICDCIHAHWGDDLSFKHSVGRALCALIAQGGGGAAGDDVEFLFLCDDQGGGTVVQFIRRIITDSVGVPTSADYELDGTTVYAPSGTVEACSALLIDNETLLLLDDQGTTSVPFIRQIRLGDGGLVTVVDTELDGTTPYATSGTVKTGEPGAEALSEKILQDTVQPFLRRTQIDSEGNVSITNLELDGTSAYAPVGAVTPLDVTVENNQVVPLLDDQGPISVPFLRQSQERYRNWALIIK